MLPPEPRGTPLSGSGSSSPATQVAPWHNSLRHPHLPPHCSQEREKKIVLLLKKKRNNWWWKWGMDQAQQPNPCRPRPPVPPSQFGSGTTALPTLYDILSHLLRFSHRLRVVVSPVPAACPMWLLDTRLVWNSLKCLDWLDYNGKVCQPTHVAPLPFWAAAWRDSVRHLESFAGGILSPILLLQKKKKWWRRKHGCAVCAEPPRRLKKKKTYTREKWYSIANYDGNYAAWLAISRGIMEIRTNWRIDADCHKCRGNLTSIGVQCECLVLHFAHLVLGSALMFFALEF